jgi:recombination protein RecT
VDSYVLAIASCASADLSLNKALSQAYLTPYKACVTFAIMAQGFIECIMRTGMVASIQTGSVYQGELDTFDCQPGQPIVHHQRLDCNRDDDAIVGFYAEARMLTGPPVHEMLNRAEADRIKRMSKAQGGPWSQWYGEMGKKSAVRRLAKLLPKGQNPAAILALTRALEIDNADYSLEARQAESAVREHGRELLAKAKAGPAADMPIPAPPVPQDAPKAPQAPATPSEPAKPAPASPDQLATYRQRLAAVVAEFRKGESDLSDAAWIDRACRDQFQCPVDQLTAPMVVELGRAVKAGAFDKATGERIP